MEFSTRSCEQYELPEWLLLEVLLRLPVKSILRFKCVCKDWLSLISDPSFIRSYNSQRMSDPSPSFGIIYRYIYASEFQKVLNRLCPPDVYKSKKLSFSCLYSSREETEAKLFKVLAASNGLVLCCSLDSQTHYVGDLVTGHWVTLPGANSDYMSAGIVNQVNEENVVTSYTVVCIKQQQYWSELFKLAIFLQTLVNGR
ncbi:putative F-box/kelch-repeat protein At1g15680 [Cornus florida]|uniref:putative F-box/kelch-repeat protein At1g15680 n=1 Tax=Cornus florida TaxID=4283 RepID=UPI0028A24048|nr:putative F-box/kelch-repeat protein At1g15680 [Cornus florida]